MVENTPKPMNEWLSDAALQGDVSLLQDLLLRDPVLLHRLPSTSDTSPLLVACNLGHTNFMLEILHRNPNRMEELDPNDKSSLLHLAARNGYLQLVTSLVSINPCMCYKWDMHGLTPLHVAVIKGQLHVLEELLRSTPDAARERVGLLLGGDTIMHLCIKFNRFDALMLAVRMVGDSELLNATNVDGNTILHLAVANKRLEIVEFLLRDKRLKKNTQNLKGSTAMDIFKESPRDLNNNNVDDHRLRLALQREKVLPSEVIKKKVNNDKRLVWFENQRSTLMVVASLIATMAFQAGVNPPGGLWQENTPPQPSSIASTNAPSAELSDLHYAGLSIMAQQDSYHYSVILVCNTLGFILSMTSILLLISGLPCKRLFMALVMVTMWVALSAMSLSYLFSTIALLPDGYLVTEDSFVFNTVRFVVILWVCVMGLLLLGHVIWWTLRFIKHLCKCGFPETT